MQNWWRWWVVSCTRLLYIARQRAPCHRCRCRRRHCVREPERSSFCGPTKRVCGGSRYLYLHLHHTFTAAPCRWSWRPLLQSPWQEHQKIRLKTSTGSTKRWRLWEEGGDSACADGADEMCNAGSMRARDNKSQFTCAYTKHGNLKYRCLFISLLVFAII